MFEFLFDNIWITLAVLSVGFSAFALKKIDLVGAIAGVALAFSIWYGAGDGALLTLFLFFVFGTAVSSWKKKQKEKMQLEQENQGKRTITHVLANGGTALIIAAIAITVESSNFPFGLLIAASFATACSDTFSSELGNVYGTKYFNIMTGKKAKRGPDGVVSLAGFAFGLVGSLIIALGWWAFDHDYTNLLLITSSGLLGNVMDSILGATWQRKGWINNHQVNFIATLSGSLIALFFSMIM